ncbi:MAG: PQQ-dependent sugar dehydrogenase [Actinomycetota bacterium]
MAAVLLSCALIGASCTGSGGEDPRFPDENEQPREASVGDDETAPRGGDPLDRFRATRVALELRSVAGGFEAPLYVTHAGDGSDRLYVVEQGGLIQTMVDGRVDATPFLDISDLTEPGGEQGLLGLAFHPDFENNHRLFVNYTDNEGDTVVAEYRAGEAGADPSSARVLMRIQQPYSNHNGGALEFGPDGFLYIATGDGGSAGDPEDRAENRDVLLGKLLRIDVDGDSPYEIPADNPFADGGGRPEVWAYGLRNPWRFSFDRITGTLWIGDVGQGAREEVNRVASREGGLDYGWNEMEGTACFEPSTDCDEQGSIAPITEYTHEEGCSISGGYVYRGRRFPGLRGGYFFGDYCSGKLWAIDANGPARQRPVELLDTERAISSFGVDASGELYLTDLASGEVLLVTGGRS